MSEKENNSLDAVLDDVMGGSFGEDKDHSPDTKETAEEQTETEVSNAPETEEVFDPFADEATFVDDSAEKEHEKEDSQDNAPDKKDSAQDDDAAKKREEETEALKKEIANYEKRLRDTQKAMHEANTERAKLQKELDSIRSRKEESGDDNWFDSSEDKTAQLETKIKDLENKQEQFQQDLAVEQWITEAKKLSTQYDDYEDLVFNKLEPMLDETTGDQALIAAYTKWQDKSPAGAYEFAKRFFGYNDRINGTATKEVSENKTKEAERTVDPHRGKAGLDRMNSAAFAEPRRVQRDMVEELFG
jgi:chromosome segregation ATPase